MLWKYCVCLLCVGVCRVLFVFVVCDLFMFRYYVLFDVVIVVSVVVFCCLWCC